MNARTRDATSASAVLLTRHHWRRQHRLPAVSALVGPITLGLHSVELWGESQKRPVVFVQVEQPTPAVAVVPWTQALVRQCNLADVAISWLAERLSRSVKSLRQSLLGMTHYEVGRFFDAVLPLSSENGTELVVRWLIEQTLRNGLSEGPELAPVLSSPVEPQGFSWLRLFEILGDLVHGDQLPVLAVAPAIQDDVLVEKIARLLSELASSQPLIAIALLVEPALFETYMARAPASRAKALLRQSTVILPPTGESFSLSSIETWTSKTGDFQAGVVCSPNREDHKSKSSGRDLDGNEFDDDPARSAAERFLFDQLESTPQTAGLFMLNRSLDFCFGLNRLVEVDLACSALKLVVEIDGYHHFQDPMAYRRDRRKDLELQKHGYLVVRILASDVVERLEEVMDTILTAVEFRRQTIGC